VFEALERIAAGDPKVRLVVTDGDTLAEKLRRKVNDTAENLTEIVEMTHEFAIGLAENFDVLQRVSSGDLTARIRGESSQEIVQCLRDLTNGTIDQLAGEIQSHREAQAELIRLAAAVEQSAEGMVITDIKGFCEYANPAFVKMTGYTRSEIYGRNLRELESLTDRETLHADMWGKLGKGNVWRGRLLNRRKDGRSYEEDCTISPIHDEAGKISKFVVIKRDVSQEVEMRRRLDQSQKLEALGTLAGGIAHELNNLLTPIMGFTELSLDDPGMSARTKKNLQHVLGAAERAREVIWQILAFSRGETKAAEAVELDTILRDSLELLRAAIPSTVDIRLVIECSRPPVVLSGITQLQQMLMNLAINAAAAMPNGTGTLRVVLRDAAPESLGEQLLHSGAEFVELLCSDNGSGMRPEEMERIFEPFYTTKPVGEGTGLGLAVVHGIVSGMGGLIRVESAIGEGTTFHIILPCVSPDGSGELTAGEGFAFDGKGRILLVDDETPVAEVFRRQLEVLGYSVDMHTKPEDALSAFLKEPGAYDLVLTDNAMPGISGLILCAEIRAKREDLPIIICTGYGGVVSLEQKNDLDIFEVLNKPVTRVELAKTVWRALGKAG
jgi:PAS domain S-box-containing protein